LALLDGQTDREPQPAFATFDWKRIQLAAIQFDIVQEFLAALEGLQAFVKNNFTITKTQECHLLAYSHYLDYLQRSGGLVLIRRGAAPESLQISEEARNGVAATAKNILLKCFYGPLFKHVAYIQTNKMWTEIADVDPDLPVFSLPPSEYVTAVGEQLMTVIHRFESLNATIMTSPEKTSLYTALYVKEAAGKGKDPTDTNNVDVSVYWVVVIGMSICQVLTGKYIQIHTLSEQGCRQLSADIGYILSIFRVINVDAALRSALESVLVALKMDVRVVEVTSEKAAKVIEANEELRAVSKNTLDLGIMKSIITKRLASLKPK
jgi:hypothetical protein